MFTSTGRPPGPPGRGRGTTRPASAARWRLGSIRARVVRSEMVGIVLLSLLGVLSHWGLGRLERMAVPWRAP